MTLCKPSYLHDFGPDCTQHMFQALGNANICTAVHMAVHRDDLTDMPNILRCNHLQVKGETPIQNDSEIRFIPFPGKPVGTARTSFALRWTEQDWLDLMEQWWWAGIQEVYSGKTPDKYLTRNCYSESWTMRQIDILVVLDRMGSRVTGLFWDRTPTAGSHGRFSSKDSASALGEPDFADVSSILSISKGIFQDRRGKSEE